MYLFMYNGYEYVNAENYIFAAFDNQDYSWSLRDLLQFYAPGYHM